MLKNASVVPYIPASNVARARRFYEEKVGLAAREETELRARGVTFEEYSMPGLRTVNGIATTGKNKAAWFKDTEGNIMAIIQTIE